MSRRRVRKNRTIASFFLKPRFYPPLLFVSHTDVCENFGFRTEQQRNSLTLMTNSSGCQDHIRILFWFGSQANRVNGGNEILKFASQMAGQFWLGGFKKGIERMGSRQGMVFVEGCGFYRQNRRK
jgi:hypothetical protein